VGKIAQKPLFISGRVTTTKPFFASPGDVRIAPGANRTNFVDGWIFDGQNWCALNLAPFLAQSRTFDHGGQIGSIMRSIAGCIEAHRGTPVYYDRTGSSTKSAYSKRGWNPFAPQFR